MWLQPGVTTSRNAVRVAASTKASLTTEKTGKVVASIPGLQKWKGGSVFAAPPSQGPKDRKEGAFLQHRSTLIAIGKVRTKTRNL